MMKHHCHSLEQAAGQAKWPRRGAFTIAEMLVSIAIIGVLIGLMLPAIQAARESARRSQCAVHMRQLAIGALSFESTRRRLPGGTGFFATTTTPITPKHFHGQGWIVEILPFIEQQPLYDVFAAFRTEEHESNLHRIQPAKLKAIIAQPDEFVCPSDASGRELITTQYQWKNVLVAPTNYRGVIGSNLMSPGTNSFPVVQPLQERCDDGRVRCNGMIWRTSSQYPVKLKDVTDGVSKTMMVGEDLPSHNWHTMWSFSNGDTGSTYASLNHSLNHPDPAAWWDMRGFRSYHACGANFAFGDGSIRFIQEDIHFGLYKAFSTIAEQEATLADAF